MYTTILLLSFARLASVSGAAPVEPAWAEDYACAYEECAAEQKPLIAFIGSGEQASQKLPLSSKAKKLLKTHFICVYIDADGEDNKLARTLNIKQGVVISTEGCRQLAFRHDGTITKRELEAKLARFSEQEPSAPKRQAPHSC